MDGSELAAYVGAAAWLPQIIAYAYNLFSRSKVRLIPDQTPSLGFTYFGPIFNLQMAFSAERKDALLERLSIRLTHEGGDIHELSWVGHSEEFHIRGGDNSLQQKVQKEAPPIALKIVTTALVEKQIRFQESAYLERHRPLLAASIAKAAYLRRKSAAGNHEELWKSPEIDALIDFPTQVFWWRPGTYTAEFRASSLNGAVVVDNRYGFDLSREDCENLQANLQFVSQYVRNEVFSGAEDFQSEIINWRWCNPRLYVVS